MFKTFAASTLVTLVAAELPYNPSSLWVSTSGKHAVVYYLESTSNGVNFQFTNLTKTFDGSSPFLSSLPPPPLSSTDTKAIVPIADPDGIPTIYTGDCRSSNAEIWQFKGNISGEDKGGNTWTKSTVRQNDSKNNLPWKGPNYLAAGITFSSQDSDPAPDLYVFAGMCPLPETSQQSWVSGAQYSRNMTYLQPWTTSKNPDYKIEMLSIRSPPVAEAGFTMTPLVPAYSNSSTGALLRHQSFVLSGGHTQTAFVNMSQIALFSLPEQSWSYVTVNEELSDSSQARLPAGISGIEPRSGHSAVLTPDGSKIVIFGGWVGDTSVPAQPQLAILEIGKDYGGSGDWTWNIPKPSPGGPLDDVGIFGHGATMLPGGVMLIKGGYKIARKSSKRSNDDFTVNDQVFLFNTTSGSWATSYTAPLNSSSANGHHHGPLSTTSQKVGLGLGLGVGVPVAALGIFACFVLRNRHSRKHRKNREQTIRSLALGAERPHFEAPDLDLDANRSMMQIDSAQRHAFNGFQEPHSPPSGSVAAERTGLLVENPSPTRGLRASVRSRGHQQVLFHDDARRNIKFTQIQPIDEGEEYDVAQCLQEYDADGYGQSKSSNSDPFKDPPSPSKACFPSLVPQDRGGPQISGENVRNWVHTLSEEKLGADRQDRTLSNLSGTSGTSSSSNRTNPRLLDRSASQRSVSVSNRERAYTAESEKAIPGRAFLPGRPSSQMSISQLQAEGSSLLGNNPSWMPQQDPAQPTEPRPASVTLELAGTIRRVLGSLRRSDSNKAASRAESLAANQRSSSTSPTKSFYSLPDEENQANPEGVQTVAQRPRRAVSTSSSALRFKQGAKDWNAQRKSHDSSLLRQGRARYDSPSLEVGSVGGGASFRSSEDDYDFDDEDWDVEAAAEGRVVQVTFTVPKERLRVVNAGAGDPIADDDEHDDDKNLRRKNALNDAKRDTGGSMPNSQSMKSIDDVFVDATEGNGKAPQR